MASADPYRFPCTSANQYCKEGSTSPSLVPPGNFSVGCNISSSIIVNGDLSSAYSRCQDMLACESGFACTNGIKTPCTAGRYSFANAASCLECPPSTFQNQSMASTCFTCATGTIAPRSGSVNCTACPPVSHNKRVHAPCESTKCITQINMNEFSFYFGIYLSLFIYVDLLVCSSLLFALSLSFFYVSSFCC